MQLDSTKTPDSVSSQNSIVRIGTTTHIIFQEILLKSAIGKYDFPEVEKFNKHIDGVLDGVGMLQIATNVHTNLLAIDTNREIQVLSVHVDQSRQENSSFQKELLQENRTFQDFMLGKNGRLDVMMKDAAKSGFTALAQGMSFSVEFVR